MQICHIQSLHRIIRYKFISDLESVPFFLQIHTHFAFFLRLWILRFADLELFRKLTDKLFAAQSIKSLYDPVVVHDLKLIGRKQNGKEVIVFLVPGMIRICFASHKRDTDCRRGPVMAIGNICAVKLCKFLHERFDIVFVAYRPHSVADIAFSSKITVRLTLLVLFYQGVYTVISAVG